MEDGIELVKVAVEPIRDPGKMNAMKKYPKGKNIRGYVLYIVGVNEVLGISDLLGLTWGDVLENKKCNIINWKERKNKKNRSIKFNRAFRKALEELLDSLDTYDMDNYIFKSREGDNGVVTYQQV